MATGLHIQKIGKGPHLAMLHGWGMNSTVWASLAKTLSKFFTVHLVDLPGMGSSQPIAPYDLTSVSQTIAEQLPDQTIVVGWSFGGLIAMHIALTQPEVISKLVLSKRSHWRAGVAQSVFDGFAKNVAADYQKAMLNFLGLQCVGIDGAKRLLRSLKTQFAAQPVPTMASLQAALTVLMQADLREELAQIHQETMIIHGDKDLLVPLQAGNWLAQAIPNARMCVLNGAAHAPFLSHPTKFEKELLSFLQVKKSVWQMFLR